ncbi:MAG: hypothetical protein ACAI43_17920 [Phycisphaerae bacterium]|nr:hypothetical protein [Tepidisphaeraceae bacterium]
MSTTPLDYGRPDAWRLRPWVKVVAALLVMAALLWCGRFVPVSKSARRELCTICDAARVRHATYWWDVRVWSSETPQRTEGNDIYDELIAEPHDHDWRGAGSTSTRGSLYGGGSVACADGDPKSRVPYASLWTLTMTKDWSIEDRRAAYARLRTAAVPAQVELLYQAEVAGRDARLGTAKRRR